jgi:hypothetical protein
MEDSPSLLKRTSITKLVEAERVVVEFDEEYQAGSKIMTKSHFLDEFTTRAALVMQALDGETLEPRIRVR